MKKILFLVVGIILLVVLAAAGMSFIGGGGGAEKEVTEVKPEVPLDPAAPVTYELRPISIPLVRDNKVRQYIIMVGRIELMARPDQASLAEENRPLLRDAIVREIHATPIKLKDDGSFDQRDLDARLRASAEKVFDKGIVQSVEIGVAQASRPAPPAAAPPPPPKKSSGGH